MGRASSLSTAPRPLISFLSSLKDLSVTSTLSAFGEDRKLAISRKSQLRLLPSDNHLLPLFPFPLFLPLSSRTLPKMVKAAVTQITSTNDVAHNLKISEFVVRGAANEGAKVRIHLFSSFLPLNPWLSSRLLSLNFFQVIFLPEAADFITNDAHECFLLSPPISKHDYTVRPPAHSGRIPFRSFEADFSLFFTCRSAFKLLRRSLASRFA